MSQIAYILLCHKDPQAIVCFLHIPSFYKVLGRNLRTFFETVQVTNVQNDVLLGEDVCDVSNCFLCLPGMGLL